VIRGKPIRSSSIAGAVLLCCLPHSGAQAFVRAPSFVRAICAGGAVRSESIREVRVGESSVWVATDEVFLQFRDGAWRRWTHGDGYPTRAVSAMDVDAVTQEVWLGTWGDGLIRFSGGRFDRFNQFNSGLAGNIVFAVLFAQGKIFAATNGGLSVFDPASDEWELHFARQADGSQPVISRLRLNKTEVLAKSWRGDAFQLDSRIGKWIRVEDAGWLTGGTENCSVSPAMARANGGASATRTAPVIALFIGANRPIALPGEPFVGIEAMERPDTLAVQLAVEAANRQALQCGLREIELRVPSPGYASYGWGLPEDELIAFADDPLILGMVGILDDRNSLLEAVVCRTGIPFVNAASLTRATETRMEGNTWHFRCWGDLPRQHRRLIDYALDDLGLNRFAIVQTPGEAIERHLAWWRSHLTACGTEPVFDALWQPGVNDEGVLETLREARPDAVLTWCDAGRSAKLLASIRRMGIHVWFLGSDAIVNEEFAAKMGPDENRVLALQALPLQISQDDYGGFAARYSDSASSRNIPAIPDADAYQSFLATDHLATAVQQNTEGRGQLGRVLKDLEQSAKGESHFERLVTAKPLMIARLRSGQWVRQSLPVRK